MTQKEMIQDHAMHEFDKCLEKYAQKIKNCLYTVICHAYNAGYKEGLKEVRSVEVEALKTEIRIGDEVSVFDENGKPGPCSPFFVTEYEPGEYIGGIDAEGSTSFHGENEDINQWKPTGRHVDIEPLLNALK